MSASSKVIGKVAILGGTGDLGEWFSAFVYCIEQMGTENILFRILGLHISRIFLTEFREYFPITRITTRDPSATKAQELAKLGAEIYRTTDSFDDVLSGIDIVINALPTFIPDEAKKQLLAAVARANPKVYFMSEFGACVLRQVSSVSVNLNVKSNAAIGD